MGFETSFCFTRGQRFNLLVGFAYKLFGTFHRDRPLRVVSGAFDQSGHGAASSASSGIFR